MQLEHSDPALPVIVVRNDFAGAKSAAAKVFTFNFMANGPVQTPSGPITPEMRTHPYSAKATNLNQLPSASPVFPLGAGVSQLSFTGPFGVDFEVFIVTPQTQQALLGNWADSWTQQPLAKWEERHDILRIFGTNSFQLVIVPFRAGHQPPSLKLNVNKEGLVLTANGTAHLLPP